MKVFEPTLLGDRGSVIGRVLMCECLVQTPALPRTYVLVVPLEALPHTHECSAVVWVHGMSDYGHEDVMSYN